MEELQPPARKRFSVLLPSDPVWLPFKGSFEGVAILADQDRVMGLGQRLLDIAGDLQDELDRLRAELSKHQVAFTRQWGPYEQDLRARARAEAAGDEYPGGMEAEVAWLEQGSLYRTAQLDYTRLLNATTRRMSEIRRQINLRIIEDTILRIGVAVKQRDPATGQVNITWSWPFDDPPPDPQSPETFASWPDVVISWLAEEAQEEVQKQLRSPNLNGR